LTDLDVSSKMIPPKKIFDPGCTTEKPGRGAAGSGARRAQEQGVAVATDLDMDKTNS
jgi:hypothetical protein